MAEEPRNILQSFSLGRMLLPVGIGLGITMLLLWRTTSTSALSNIHWTWNTTGWMSLALLSLVVRDWMYMLRMRLLSDNQLTWWRSFVVIMLWEFASAIIPGTIGGGFFFIIWVMSREGMDTGRSITIITTTSFLDGIFLAIMAPLVYFTVGRDQLFTVVESGKGILGNGFLFSFWLVYFVILSYKIFVAYALFFNPLFVKRALVGIFSLRFLRRWRKGAATTGDQLITAANGLKDRSWSYWWPAVLTTFASWTARYSIINCILHAFQDGAHLNDAVIYGKQVIMGILILLSPTPGGSGLAEWIFSDFLGMYVMTGLAPAIALIWRLMSYYPYIAIGAALLPRWLRRNLIDPLATVIK